MSVLPHHITKSLCSHCQRCRVIVSGKGSTFLMCREGTLPKYPRQPVAACDYYQPKIMPKTREERCVDTGLAEDTEHS